MSKILLFLLLALGAHPVLAAVDEADRHLRTLRTNDATVQNLKTRTVNVLGAIDDYRKARLFPAEQRFALYLTSPARRFTAQKIAVRSGDQLLVERELNAEALYAMRIGGLAPLYEGNVAEGRLRLQVTIDGVMPEGQPVRHEAEMTLQKLAQPQALELQIRDTSRSGGISLNAIEREVQP